MYTVSAFVLVLACKIEPSRFLHLECLKRKTIQNFAAMNARRMLNAWKEWRSTLFDSPSTQSAHPAPLK